jgi:hypothetical protein
MAVKDRNEAIEALEHSEAALREATNGVERARAALEDSGDRGLTVTHLAERFGLSEDALVAFARTAAELVGENGLSVDAARRAALLAAAEQAWENELGPLLSSAQVRELLGDVSRQRVDELLRARRLIGLRDQSGRRRFPAFQFRDGRPEQPLIDAFWTIASSPVDEWTAASWCVSPDPALEERSPAQWAREGRDRDRLARIARQDAARLAR